MSDERMMLGRFIFKADEFRSAALRESDSNGALTKAIAEVMYWQAQQIAESMFTSSFTLPSAGGTFRQPVREPESELNLFTLGRSYSTVKYPHCPMCDGPMFPDSGSLCCYNWPDCNGKIESIP